MLSLLQLGVNVSVHLFTLLYTGRLDDKDSVDIHDNPPLPDNVVKEEDNMVRGLAF